MKVLFCAPINLSFIRGGIITAITSIKTALEEKGVHVDFLNPLEPVDRGEYDILHIFSSVASFDLYFMADYAKKTGIKIVFNPIFYGQWPPWLIRAEVAVLSRIPHVYNWHVYLKKILDMSDSITPNTRTEADYIRRSFGVGNERMHFVPNGVNERFLKGDAELIRKELGLRDFILTVGYVSERKNQTRVLEAARRLGMPYVSIGKMQDDEYCRQFRRMAAKRQDVFILDQMANDDPMLASAYAAASVFVLASWWETPGIAALEAAIAGAPVLVTEVGGTRDYFGDLADYATHGSVESICEGIRRARARPRDGVLQEHVRRNFAWPAVGQTILDIYNTLKSDEAKHQERFAATSVG